jgi:hypothetical protein
LQHIVGWFDKYLQGMSKPEYDDVASGADLPGKHDTSKPESPAGSKPKKKK